MELRLATRQDAAAIARVNVATWRATYRGIVPDAYLESLSAARLEETFAELLADRSSGRFDVVADDPTEGVVAYAAGGPQRAADGHYTGEIYGLYVLPAFQGRGLGRRLLIEVASRLREERYAAFLVWVVAANRPARRFYEALGGRWLRERSREIGGVPLSEVGYGWSAGLDADEEYQAYLVAIAG